MRNFPSLVMIAYIACASVYALPKLSHHKLTLTANMLAEHTHNNILDLSHSNISDQDIPSVIRYLKNHTAITSLNLEDDELLTRASFLSLATVNTLTE